MRSTSKSNNSGANAGERRLSDYAFGQSNLQTGFPCRFAPRNDEAGDFLGARPRDDGMADRLAELS
jgi:hypothetical protein